MPGNVPTCGISDILHLIHRALDLVAGQSADGPAAFADLLSRVPSPTTWPCLSDRPHRVLAPESGNRSDIAAPYEPNPADTTRECAANPTIIPTNRNPDAPFAARLRLLLRWPRLVPHRDPEPPA